MEEWESDSIVEQWILEHDHTVMPLPSMESNPHLLISKVRKHYMEYLIKLLSVNYESNQKLLNKNIYLPSAIWRCAKIIEMSAAQTAMVVSLYRNNINNVVQELKKTTKKGLLYKKLYECLHFQPENEKKTQTTLNSDNSCSCQCICNLKDKAKRLGSPKMSGAFQSVENDKSELYKDEDYKLVPVINNSLPKEQTEVLADTKESDDLMLQLEKLFQGDPNDDDIFDSALYDTDNCKSSEETKVPLSDIPANTSIPEGASNESQALESKSFDDSLSLLSGMIENNHVTSFQDSGGTKCKKAHVSKWICEEYFMKLKLYELLDQIRDSDRNKLARIKAKLRELFGDDSDDESVISPLDESPDFVTSCKERIAPWVVQILTPYYVNGRIRGKNLFKALAKHLIKLIYQCSKYPRTYKNKLLNYFMYLPGCSHTIFVGFLVAPCSKLYNTILQLEEYEVQSFIKDFLNNHRMIRCEADFKQFKIENV